MVHVVHVVHAVETAAFSSRHWVASREKTPLVRNEQGCAPLSLLSANT